MARRAQYHGIGTSPDSELVCGHRARRAPPDPRRLREDHGARTAPAPPDTRLPNLPERQPRDPRSRPRRRRFDSGPGRVGPGVRNRTHAAYPATPVVLAERFSRSISARNPGRELPDPDLWRRRRRRRRLPAGHADILRPRSLSRPRLRTARRRESAHRRLGGGSRRVWCTTPAARQLACRRRRAIGDAAGPVPALEFGSLDAFLEGGMRPDIHVTWLGLSPTPMRFKTQPLHRLLAWRVLEIEKRKAVGEPRHRYQQGKIQSIELLDQAQREGALYDVKL